MPQDQPLAEVELFLAQEPRDFFPNDLRIGGVRFRGWRVDPLITEQQDHDAYLVRVDYELDLQSDSPAPLWAEVGFEITTEDVIVIDAIPRTVYESSQRARYAVTPELDFIRYEPDMAGRMLHDHVPVPDLTPVVDTYGIGSPSIRWHRSQDIRPGSQVGWLILLAAGGCTELKVRAFANYDLLPDETLGMFPRGRPATFVIRLPPGRAAEGFTIRLGFTVDIVGYSQRDSDDQSRAQRRVKAMFDTVLSAAAIVVDRQYFQPTGDGFHAFLPTSADPHKVLAQLFAALPGELAENNRADPDRLKLRVAMDIGTVGVGPLGLTGDTVTNFCRLVDSAPIRHAVETDNDLAVLVSEDVYDRVIRNFSDLSTRGYEQVDISVKGYQAAAYLWTPAAN